jgi:hypothetical protein
MSAGDVPVRIEIERPPLSNYVMRNDRTTPLTLVSYRDPARQTRVEYAPSSAFEDGEIPLAVSLQQSLLVFSVAARVAESEWDAKSALFELDQVVRGLDVRVHVIWESHTEIWACHAGGRAPAGERTYADLRDHDPVWDVSLPCHPVPTITV